LNIKQKAKQIGQTPKISREQEHRAADQGRAEETKPRDAEPSSAGAAPTAQHQQSRGAARARRLNDAAGRRAQAQTTA
jgi:hypothetical protein